MEVAKETGVMHGQAKISRGEYPSAGDQGETNDRNELQRINSICPSERLYLSLTVGGSSQVQNHLIY